MAKKIGFKEIVTKVPSDAFISKINGLVGRVKNVTLEVNIKSKKVYEEEDYMYVLLKIEDSTGSMSALLPGNRVAEFKSLVQDVKFGSNYRIAGNVFPIDGLFDERLPFEDEIIGDKLFCIYAIQNISSYILFGVDIAKLYDYDLHKAYDFVNNNTDYLKNISIDEVKDIKFSCDHDVIILLHKGIVLLNGKSILSNIKMLGFMSGIFIFAFSNDNVITCPNRVWDSVKFMNNNNYKYKKIIVTPLVIVALTFEKDIRLFGTLCDNIFDYHRFFDVDDIGYVEDNDDIVVIKGDKVYSLFHENDYSNEVPDVIVEGSIDSIDIIE